MNILVIEDDQFTRKLISQYLLESGYTVRAASNGQEALNHIEGGRKPDVILVDLFMPELTGPSFLIKVRHLFSGQLPKIVVVSGAREGEDFLKKLGTDYDHYVPKPIDFAHLGNLLHGLSHKS